MHGNSMKWISAALYTKSCLVFYKQLSTFCVNMGYKVESGDSLLHFLLKQMPEKSWEFGGSKCGWLISGNEEHWKVVSHTRPGPLSRRWQQREIKRPMIFGFNCCLWYWSNFTWCWRCWSLACDFSVFVQGGCWCWWGVMGWKLLCQIVD